MWWPTKSAHRPTSVTWSAHCWRSPTAPSANRCCTPPTKAKSADSARPVRCSRASARIRSGYAPSVPTPIRVLRADRRIRRCLHESPPRRGRRRRGPGGGAQAPAGPIHPSARRLPSLIRGGMHAVVGPFWKANPWTAEYRQERTEPSERPVGWLSGSCLLLRRSAFDEVSGFDERYFMYMEDVDLGDRLGKAGWQNVYVPSAEILHDKGHATGRDPARNLAAHHTSTYTFLADRHPKRWQAPLRWTIRAALAARGGLVVRSSRRSRRKDGA